MNAADEHGIIHPGTCTHPITGEKGTAAATANDTTNISSTNSGTNGGSISAPGDDSSLQSETLKAEPKPEPKPEPAPGAGAGAGARGGGGGGVDRGGSGAITGAGGGAAPQTVREVIRPMLLGVLQELCELTRPEIAASTVVAGACKVKYLVVQH